MMVSDSQRAVVVGGHDGEEVAPEDRRFSDNPPRCHVVARAAGAHGERTSERHGERRGLGPA